MSPHVRRLAAIAGGVLLAIGFTLLAVPLLSLPEAAASPDVARALCAREDVAATTDVPVGPALSFLFLGSALLLASALLPDRRPAPRPARVRMAREEPALGTIALAPPR